MYDIQLFEEVKNFKLGVSNIYQLEYKYHEINRIIQNRTKDKIWFLNKLLLNRIIDLENYKILIDIVKNDYKIAKSMLYV